MDGQVMEIKEGQNLPSWVTSPFHIDFLMAIVDFEEPACS